MILLRDTIRVLNYGYFMVSYTLFTILILFLKIIGCRRSESADAIIVDCFNRSHAVNCGK